MDGVYGQATMIVEWVRKGRVWNEAVGMEKKKKKRRRRRNIRDPKFHHLNRNF